MSRIDKIRSKEKEYHDHCYDNYKLFEQGSWLHKPVRTILDLFAYFDELEEVQVLDLGCGIGRNSIPLAEKIGARKGTVVCVDLLESAIEKLRLYSKEFNVADKIECKQSDIAEYSIASKYFNFIFAVSSMEHVESETQFDRVIEHIVRGTKVGGINCIIISTNISETAINSGKRLDPMYELQFETDQLIRKLQGIYSKWEILQQTVKPYELEIERDGQRIILQGDVLTWAVRKMQ
ncbi:class I SAM-dependent methyltransferase [Paenibacillus brevis]|nr:class I SAM-dependent methyltransferase [Paenibacillus brevis]